MLTRPAGFVVVGGWGDGCAASMVVIVVNCSVESDSEFERSDSCLGWIAIFDAQSTTTMKGSHISAQSCLQNQSAACANEVLVRYSKLLFYPSNKSGPGPGSGISFRQAARV